MKTGRNDPCSCGSGKKYKHCCERKKARRASMQDSLSRGLFLLLGPLAIAVIAAVVISALRDPAASGEARRVWSATHGHWHLLGPDGTEVEARPGLVWSDEQGQFVQAQPITEGTRKHVTADLDERIGEVAGEPPAADPDDGAEPDAN